MDGISTEVRQGKNGEYARVVFGTFESELGGPVEIAGVTKPEFGLRSAANSLRNPQNVSYWASRLDRCKRIGFRDDRKSVVVEIPGAKFAIGDGEPTPVVLKVEVASQNDVRLGVTDLARQLLNRIANRVYNALAAETKAAEEPLTVAEPVSEPPATSDEMAPF